MESRANCAVKVEGCPPMPAPWHVESYVRHDGATAYLVRARDGLVVIQPDDGAYHKAFCEAVARSRNEGTDRESIAYIEARYHADLKAAHEETDRVRAHFRAEIDRVMETNRELQNAIVEARRTGRVDGLPSWCQPSEEPGSTAPPDLPFPHSSV